MSFKNLNNNTWGKSSFSILDKLVGRLLVLKYSVIGFLWLLYCGQSIITCWTSIGIDHEVQFGCRSLLKWCFLLNKHVPNLSLLSFTSSDLFV